MQLELGLSSFSFGWAVGDAGKEAGNQVNLLNLIQITHSFGLRLLQTGDNLPLHLYDEAVLRKAKEKLREYDMSLELGMRGLYTDRVVAYIKLAAFFHSKLIRIVIDDQDYEPSMEECVAIFRSLLPTLEESNIQMGIENHDRFTVQQLADMIKQINSPYVGICLDVANSYGAGESVHEVIETLLPYTINLHLKGFTIRRHPYKMGFSIDGAPVGTTRFFDLPGLISKLKLQNKNANCILEVWTPPETTAVQTCEKERSFVVQSLDYLKPMFQ